MAHMNTKTTILSLVAILATCTAPAQSFTIEADQPRQTIRHFGASDAWSMQYIGLWDNEREQQQVADWLFSLQTDDHGQPLGIGLSLWRFNLGAGSSEQGRNAQINASTRTECLLKADGSYDWSRQAGQRRFLRMARRHGVPHFLAFLNSVPVYFTQNGLATNTGRGGTINLRPECYADVARFIVTALKGIEEHDSIHFDYLSPVNEPDGHWNWTGPKQEGSPATHREIARLVRSIDSAMTRQQMNTQILVDESSDLRCVLGIYQTTWERGHALSTFFNPDSTATYLGSTPHVPHVMAAHSYWTNTPIPYMRRLRQQLRDEMRQLGVAYWQSELCIMGNDEEIGGGGGYDFTMKTALYVARVIHHDLMFGDAESWSWWRAVGGDYKDGLIRAYGGLSPREQQTDGSIRSGRCEASRLMWALGNYSRFVRPGAVRHEVSSSARFDPYGVMLSAYRNANGKWVAVAINYSEQPQPLQLSLSTKQSITWQMYRTSDADGETLRPVGTTDGATTLPPRCIVSFVE